MRRTTISAAKNGLSSLLDQVKAGESVLITDRGIPVARIQPVATSDDPSGRSQRLARAGLANPGSGALAVEYLEGPTIGVQEGRSLVQAVIKERRSGW